jgi:hypothetical protein
VKLIRLTDDRYVLDAGPGIRADHLAMLRDYWKAWWQEHPGEIPAAFVIGGHEVPLEYEDRRDADIEARVAALEREVFGEGG